MRPVIAVRRTRDKVRSMRPMFDERDLFYATVMYPNPADREAFLETLREVKSRTNWRGK
jgi:hypothetical protein